MSAPARLTVPVVLDGWQIECCGTPPALDDSVSWQLQWSPWYAEHFPTDMRLHVDLRRFPLPEKEIWRSTTPPIAGTVEEGVPAIATIGSVSIFVQASVPLLEGVTLTGALHEEHHDGVPQETPFTNGRITAVWLVSQLYRQQDNIQEPIAGSAEFLPVSRAPKHLPYEAGHQNATYRRNINAILVNLETE